MSLSRSVAAAVGWHHGQQRGVAATGERDGIHRLLRQLHPPGLSGAVADWRRAFHVSVSRRRLLQGWHRRRRPAAKPLARFDVRVAERPGADQGRADSDHDGSYEAACLQRGVVDDRLGIVDLIGPSMKHLVPHDAGWWYVFGSATTLAFIVQVVTGVALAFSYVSSSSQAYETLLFITMTRRLGISCAGCITLARRRWC